MYTNEAMAARCGAKCWTFNFFSHCFSRVIFVNQFCTILSNEPDFRLAFGRWRDYLLDILDVFMLCNVGFFARYGCHFTPYLSYSWVCWNAMCAKRDGLLQFNEVMTLFVVFSAKIMRIFDKNVFSWTSIDFSRLLMFFFLLSVCRALERVQSSKVW